MTSRFLLRACIVLVLVAVSTIVFLNRLEIVSFGWAQLTLENIRSESGFAYIAPTRRPELSSHLWSSRAEVLENGHRLNGPANALHADIRKLGSGRYSFWHAYVYFSTSDNSGPADNGRVYSIYYPRMVGGLLAVILYFATASSIAGFLVFSRDNAGSTKCAAAIVTVFRQIRDRPLGLGIFFISVVYLVTRLPFFLYYPLVGFDSDSLLYRWLAHTMGGGHEWPKFIYRTPGYPLFIRLVLSLSGDWITVVLVQSICFLASVSCLLCAIDQLKRSLVVPAALVLGGYMASTDVLRYETSILADSLYGSAVIFSVAFLILALVNPSRAIWFSAASIMMGGAVLIRPVGMYFAVIYLLVGIYILWNHFPKRALVALLIPLPTLLLSFCAYNYCTIGSFSVSLIGRMALAMAMAPYIEPEPNLSPQINQLLREVPAANRRAGVTDHDLAVLENTWDPWKLYAVFTKPFMSGLDQKTYGPLFDRVMDKDFVSNLRDLRDAELLAIRRHPSYYVKFVEANVTVFFTSISERGDFLECVSDRATGPPPPAWERARSGAGPISLAFSTGFENGRESPAARIQQSAQALQTSWFRNSWWLLAYVAAAVYSALRVVQSRGRHAGTFILLLVVLLPIGAALTTCLVNVSIPRYVFPTQFCCYLSVVLIPVTWRPAMNNDPL